MFKTNTADIYLKCLKTGNTIYQDKQYRVTPKDSNSDKLEVYDKNDQRWVLVDTFEKI